MSQSEIEIALRPFTQVDNTLERKYEGTGLGLPLSRSLTVINGGTLKLVSKPGIGTNAILHFPSEMAVFKDIKWIFKRFFRGEKSLPSTLNQRLWFNHNWSLNIQNNWKQSLLIKTTTQIFSTKQMHVIVRYFLTCVLTVIGNYSIARFNNVLLSCNFPNGTV